MTSTSSSAAPAPSPVPLSRSVLTSAEPIKPAPPVTTYFFIQFQCRRAPVRFATATSDNPCQGRSPSTRRQNHTVLSKSFSAGLLIRFRPSTLPKIHHDTAPILLS